MTVIFITHFMEEAACADHVIVMDGGKLRMEGTPREIFAWEEELKALNLDVPAAVQLASQLRARGVDLPDSILTAEELVDALTQPAPAAAAEEVSS